VLFWRLEPLAFSLAGGSAFFMDSIALILAGLGAFVAYILYCFMAMLYLARKNEEREKRDALDSQR
jgi:hypothetical protein